MNSIREVRLANEGGSDDLKDSFSSYCSRSGRVNFCESENNRGYKGPAHFRSGWSAAFRSLPED